MRVEWELARRIYGGGRGAGWVGVWGVGLGVGVMLVSVGVLLGFKGEVGAKVRGVWGDVVVSNLESGGWDESGAISVGEGVLEELRGIEGVGSAEVYVTKVGVLQVGGEYEGVVMKGRPRSRVTLRVAPAVTGVACAWREGEEVGVGEELARRLGVEVGDEGVVYFVPAVAGDLARGGRRGGGGVKVRKVRVGRIYETGFVEYDRGVVECDMGLLQGVNGWEEDEVTAVAVTLRVAGGGGEREERERVYEGVYELLGGKEDVKGNRYYVRKVEEVYPSLFGWLEVLDVNVWVLMVVMALVSGMSMTGGVLILIMERVQMIGLLRGLGMSRGGVRRTFLYVGVLLIGRGLLWGNIVGMGVCMVQKYWGVVGLDRGVYYVDAVPIGLGLGWWLAVNAGAALVTGGVVAGVTGVAGRVRPGEAMRWE
jgi:lipoprotein-releasing system permease protein